MTDVNADLVGRWGDVIRRQRLALGLRQKDVASVAGVSPSMVCRMELGRGGPVSLDAWVSVALAVGVRLVASGGQDAAWIGPLERRCHTLVAETARRGGWSTVTEIVRSGDHEASPRIETVLVRPERREVAVVRAWHPVPLASVALVDLEQAAAAERVRRGDGWAINSLVICPRTMHNRRRVTEMVPIIAPRLPAARGDWLGALANVRLAMPSSSGLIWTDRWVTRFSPAPRRPGWQPGS